MSPRFRWLGVCSLVVASGAFAALVMSDFGWAYEALAAWIVGIVLAVSAIALRRGRAWGVAALVVSILPPATVLAFGISLYQRGELGI